MFLFPSHCLLNFYVAFVWKQKQVRWRKTQKCNFLSGAVKKKKFLFEQFNHATFWWEVPAYIFERISPDERIYGLGIVLQWKFYHVKLCCIFKFNSMRSTFIRKQNLPLTKSVNKPQNNPTGIDTFLRWPLYDVVFTLANIISLIEQTRCHFSTSFPRFFFAFIFRSLTSVHTLVTILLHLASFMCRCILRICIS